MRSFIAAVTLSIAVCAFTGCTDSGDGDGGGGGDPLAQFQGDCSLRVANGTQCTPKEGPIALLTLVRNNQEIAICTGAFLTRSTVLTAAHCFVESGADSAIISAAGESGNSAIIAIHPKYRSGNQVSPYDVAIVKLGSALDVATLPLLLSEDPASADTLNVIGYGLDEDEHSAGDSPASDSLHKGVMEFEGIEEDLLIYSPGSGGQTICPGDSGSPGIVLNRDDLAGILGVASLALGTNIAQLERCKGVQYAAFANVQLAEVTDWILAVEPGTGAI